MEQVPETRTCTKCKETKDFEFFSNSSRSKYGKLPVCKKCKAEQNKKHYKYKKKLSVEPPLTRVCKKCKETKDLELFAKRTNCRFGRGSVCKECDLKKSKEYYREKCHKLGIIKPTEPPLIRTCKGCAETKAFELFTVAEKCRFGRSYVCKECTNKQSIKYHKLYYKSRPKKPKEPKEQPVTKVCIKCKETKEFKLFKSNKKARFGRENTCTECDKERKKQWVIPEKSKEKYRERARIYQRINYSKNKAKQREQNKKYQKNRIINLTKGYLKATLYYRFNIRASEVTDEQLQLQKESILLHREFKQLKQQLQ